MNRDQLKDLIVKQIEALISQTGGLLATNGKIAQLDIDLTKDKIKNLYESIELLSRLNREEKQNVASIKEKENIVIQENLNKAYINNEELVLKSSNEDEKKEERIEKTIKHEEIKNETVNIVEKTPIQIEVKPKQDELKTNQHKQEVPSIAIGEKLIEEKTVIHDKVAKETQDKSISAKLSKKQITHIKNGLGINEKFLLLKELFNQDSKFLSETIETLNACANGEEAIAMLQSYQKNYNWNDQTDGFNLLIELVQRRFI